MPRTLPWLVQAQTSAGKQKSASTAPKRRRITPNNPKLENEEEEVLASKAASSKRMDNFAPPNVEYMLDSDQFFIMVEDELHDIAHQFTRSLHRAEYQRLQALAASKNASSISEIQKSTNKSAPSLEKLLKGTVNSKRDNVTKRILQPKEEDGLSSDEEEKERMSQWQGTNLAALMLGPGQRNKDLSAKWKLKATTRAAAGFHRGKSEKGCQTISKNRTDICDSDIDDARTSRKPLDTKIKRTKPENSLRKDNTKRVHYVSDTEDNDDDLDGPALRTNSKPVTPSNATTTTTNTTIVPSLTSATTKNNVSSRLPSQSSGLPQTKTFSTDVPGGASAKRESCSTDLSLFDDFLSIPAPKSSPLHSGGYKGKAMAALAKKREMEKTK